MPMERSVPFGLIRIGKEFGQRLGQDCHKIGDAVELIRDQP